LGDLDWERSRSFSLIGELVQDISVTVNHLYDYVLVLPPLAVLLLSLLLSVGKKAYRKWTTKLPQLVIGLKTAFLQSLCMM